MATEALNFRRIGTPGYRTYRVLQARGDWAHIYRSKVADHGDHKGAIIFPEQLLSLNQNRIFAVGATENIGHSGQGSGMMLSSASMPSTMQLQWLVIERFHLWNAVDRCLITRAEEVLEYEEHNYDKDGLRGLQLTDALGARAVGPFSAFTALFTSKGDAARWLENYASKNLRKHLG